VDSLHSETHTPLQRIHSCATKGATNRQLCNETCNPNKTLPDTLLRLPTPKAGHFRFESGLHGDVWLDLDGLFLRPRALHPFVAELAARLAAHEIDAVCGPQTGGAILAQLIAAELDREFCFAARVAGPAIEYRIPDRVRSRLRAKRIVAVDDAIYAGSAIRATVADLEACGAAVTALGALMVLGDSAALFAAGMQLPLEWITRIDAGLWSAADCPLCRSYISLDDG